MVTKGDVYIRGCPRGLRDMFKAACARNGSNMNAVVRAFMQAYIDESERIHIGGDGVTSKPVRIAKRMVK